MSGMVKGISHNDYMEKSRLHDKFEKQFYYIKVLPLLRIDVRKGNFVPKTQIVLYECYSSSSNRHYL